MVDTTFSRITSEGQNMIFPYGLTIVNDFILKNGNLLVNGDLTLKGKNSSFIITNGNLKVTGNMTVETEEPITVLDGNISIGGNLSCHRVINNKTILIEGSSNIGLCFCTTLIIRGDNNSGSINAMHDVEIGGNNDSYTITASSLNIGGNSVCNHFNVRNYLSIKGEFVHSLKLNTPTPILAIG